VILVTNNVLAKEKYGHEIDVEFREESLSDLLFRVRDLVHSGHCILTHPLSGSIKPNETPFKSVLLSKKIDTTDIESLKIIENSIIIAKNFLTYPIPEEYLNDLREIDLTLIDSAIK